MYFCKKNGKNVAECSFRITTPSAAVLKKKTHSASKKHGKRRRGRKHPNIMISRVSHASKITELRDCSSTLFPRMLWPVPFANCTETTQELKHSKNTWILFYVFNMNDAHYPATKWPVVLLGIPADLWSRKKIKIKRHHRLPSQIWFSSNSTATQVVYANIKCGD